MKKNKKLLLLTVALLTGAMALTACSKNNVGEEKKENKKVEKAQTISIEDLSKNLDNRDYQVVDLRQDDAYLGYKVGGISRGGHIKNAKQFTYTWLDKLKEADTTLEKLLKDKEIDPNKNIVLYSNKNDESNDLANQMKELNYNNVFVFNDLAKWAEDKEKPMESAPNYNMIVSPEWVNDLVNGKKPETYVNDKYVILEASWGPESDAYKAGHIPGSIHFNTDNVESEDNQWNLGPVDNMKKKFEENGISYDKTVVVYSDDVAAAGRVYLALKWAGVEDVRILNGGMTAWKDAGYEAEKKDNKPTAVKDFGVKIPNHPEYQIPLPKDILEKQKDPNFRLVSIRSWDEFIGKTSGYSYIKGAGEPKGAVWGHAGEDNTSMSDYLDVDNTFRSFPEIENMWAEWDIKKGNEISFYCGTGWRAAVPWILTETQGWKDVTVFDGGWYTWEKDKSLPVQVGDPRK